MKQPEHETFKDRIERELSYLGISKKEFAADVGISINTLNMYLYRDSMPSADIAVKMARFLNTTVEYLITGNNNNGTTNSNNAKKNFQKAEIENLIASFSAGQLSAFLDITKAFYKATRVN